MNLFYTYFKKLAMQIFKKCPHPDLLPPGEGTASPFSPARRDGREAPVRAKE